MQSEPAPTGPSSLLLRRVDAFNRNLQGGTIRKGTFKYALRVVGEFESVREIGEIGPSSESVDGWPPICMIPWRNSSPWPG